MLLWALCFPLIAIGLKAAPPLYYAGLRSLLAGAGLLLPALLLRRPLPRGRSDWLSIAGVGLGATSFGFAGMFLAGGIVSPGLATVLSNAQPLFAAALAFFFLSEKMGPRRRVGMIAGFAGILVIAAPQFIDSSGGSAPHGVAFLIMAAAGVAAGNVLLKSLAGRVDPLAAIGWQFIIGSAPLFLTSLLVEAPIQVDWNWGFLFNLLFLSWPGTALAFVLWFSGLRRSELTRLNTFTFITPAAALVLGALFFNERLGWIELGGIILIIVAVWIVSRTTEVRPQAGKGYPLTVRHSENTRNTIGGINVSRHH